MTDYLQQLYTYFRNLALNASGAERTLLQLVQDGDISATINLMQNRDSEVDKAIKEYNPQTHDVMRRPNKYVKNEDPYITEKLPRSRQRYINEVALFFLLGNPVKWKKEDGDDEAFTLFKDFLRDHRFNTTMRQAKRLAGAETESAKLYHIYRDGNDKMAIKCVILARSKGHRLRPLFDQYGNMTAFAYGYKLKENGKTVQHWDIQTSEMIYFCKKNSIGWDVEPYVNPTDKINVIYYQQPTEWDGAEQRISREEMLDSKIGDTNNYFADPIATATADVIQGLASPDKPGRLIQLTSKDSVFGYVNPPQSSELRDAEKNDLNASILFDTFTPDLSFENLKGMGTLTGAAIKNALILGYIKRDNRKEIYEELIDREKNLVIAILKYLHPDKAAALDSLVITFEFSEPFTEDKERTWQSIGQLYKNGLVSLEQAVTMLALTDAPKEEIERLQQAAQKPQNGEVAKGDN